MIPGAALFCGFLQNVSEVLDKARKNAKTAVNLSMVYAYFEIGRMIFEEEQNGANRAADGTILPSKESLQKLLQEQITEATENRDV